MPLFIALGLRACLGPMDLAGLNPAVFSRFAAGAVVILTVLQTAFGSGPLRGSTINDRALNLNLRNLPKTPESR